MLSFSQLSGFKSEPSICYCTFVMSRRLCYCRGCLDAVRQLAAEFAEDMAADNIIYTEARFCPHLLASLLYTLFTSYWYQFMFLNIN